MASQPDPLTPKAPANHTTNLRKITSDKLFPTYIANITLEIRTLTVFLSYSNSIDKPVTKSLTARVPHPPDWVTWAQLGAGSRKMSVVALAKIPSTPIYFLPSSHYSSKNLEYVHVRRIFLHIIIAYQYQYKIMSRNIFQNTRGNSIHNTVVGYITHISNTNEYIDRQAVGLSSGRQIPMSCRSLRSVPRHKTDWGSRLSLLSAPPCRTNSQSWSLSTTVDTQSLFLKQTRVEHPFIIHLISRVAIYVTLVGPGVNTANYVGGTVNYPPNNTDYG